MQVPHQTYGSFSTFKLISVPIEYIAIQPFISEKLRQIFNRKRSVWNSADKQLNFKQNPSLSFAIGYYVSLKLWLNIDWTEIHHWGVLFELQPRKRNSFVWRFDLYNNEEINGSICCNTGNCPVIYGTWLD